MLIWKDIELYRFKTATETRQQHRVFQQKHLIFQTNKVSTETDPKYLREKYKNRLGRVFFLQKNKVGIAARLLYKRLYIKYIRLYNKSTFSFCHKEIRITSKSNVYIHKFTANQEQL